MLCHRASYQVLLIGLPLLTLKSSASWVEEKLTSKVHLFKNAMHVYAAELIAAQEFWAFRLLSQCFVCIINCVHTLKF